MASFDPDESTKSATNVEGMVKYPMKRLEHSVRNFIKVLDIDLDRLYKHTDNIKKLTNAEDWKGLHREQVNASRTIQQLHANIREIERARTQVADKDLHLFDAKVHDVKAKALSAMDEFMILIGPGVTIDSTETSNKKQVVETGHGHFTMKSSPSSRPMMQKADSLSTEQTQTGRSNLQLQKHSSLQCEEAAVECESQDSPPASEITYAPAPLTTKLHVVPQHSDASNSWEQLQENIVELNDLVHHFANNVEQQGEVINTIDDNIETASENVKEGTGSLAKASKYKSALLPVVGAVVGGLVGGPIGFMAGMKLGGLAGAVGGAAGFAGGRMLKKRQETISQTEMENLSDKRSLSLSELPTPHPSEASANKTGVCDNATQKEATRSGDENAEEETIFVQAEESENGITKVYSSVSSSLKRVFSQAEG